MSGCRTVPDDTSSVLGGTRSVPGGASRVHGGTRRVHGGTRRVLEALLGVVLAAAVAGAQTNPDPLTAAVREAQARGGAVWLTWRVPIAAGERRLCFGEYSTRRSEPGDLHPAAATPSEMAIYARLESGRVARIRAFTPDCPVEADGTTIVPVAGVTPAESVAWLASTVAATAGDAHAIGRIVDPAMLALSLHADPSALTRLIDIARDDARTRVRGQALFWLAQRAGERAAAAIGGAVDNDPETAVRKRAVFALSQLPKDEGVPKLIEVARTNRSPEVRKQAIFWLGQSNDPRALKFFEEILAP